MENMTALLELVDALIGGLKSAMTALTTYWWVFLPLGMSVFKFLLGSAKGLLGYRRRGRARG